MTLNHRVIVINYPDEKIWGVSFSSHNPKDSEFFACASKDEAFRLRDLINNYVSSNFTNISPNVVVP